MLEIGLKIVEYLFAIAISLLFNSIPISPGGIGVGEAAFESIFIIFGSHDGAELAILFHVIYFALAIGIGGLIYMFADYSKVNINSYYGSDAET